MIAAACIRGEHQRCHLAICRCPHHQQPQMAESQLQAAIIEAATLYGWTVFHIRDSRRQRVVGLPDLLLLKPPFAEWWELKSETGKVTEIQETTLALLHDCGFETRVMRPTDWLDGSILKRLKGA